MDDSRNKKVQALEAALNNINKQYGKGAVMTLEGGPVADVDAIPTGSLSLDLATGIGGVPRGRIVEVFGPESSGKTTLALSIVAEAQKMGEMAAYVDAEHALDRNYAQKLGVDLETMLISQPDTGEMALDIVEKLVASGALGVIVVDSVAALVPKSEIEGDMGDSTMGVQARLMSQAMRKLTGAVSKSNTCVIFINQIRMKIGVMFGNPETTTGGNALKFYASMRFDIRRISALKSGNDITGNRTRVKVVKNKLSAPFKETEFDILYGEGISRAGDILDLATDAGIVEKNGAWFSYEKERIGQGRENSRQFLVEHPEMLEEIRGKVLVKNGLGSKAATPAVLVEIPAKEKGGRGSKAAAVVSDDQLGLPIAS